MNYPTISRRLAALILDVLFWLPIFLLLNSYWKNLPQASAQVFQFCRYLIYGVYRLVFHSVWGQTPGKMITGIKVVRTDGSAIGFKKAALRSSVELVFVIFTALGASNSIQAIPLVDYQMLSPSARSYFIAQFMPDWSFLVSRAQLFWGYCDAISIWFNHECRVLHDLIGGTVVVQIAKASAPVVAGPTQVVI